MRKTPDSYCLTPRRYGAVPFWFWNGDQREDELTRQLEMAARGGLKGMAIHARRGNRTEYMSERWIALVRHACAEARRLGLDIWLYDEEGYPSGTVGHRLQRDNPFYQQKHLAYDYLPSDSLPELATAVAVYDAYTHTRVALEDVPEGQELLAFFVMHNTRYVDTLKRATAERFMDMTHHRYRACLQEYFGAPITHIYTDDLNSYLGNGHSLPYTEDLLRVFRERLGYDLLDHLPKLVENIPGCEKVRLEFRSLILALFLDEFVDPMVRWCDENGLLFTGHLSGDEGEIDKAMHRFGSPMAFYEREHVPGIDDYLVQVPSGCYIDQLRNPQNHCPVVLFKQASSVANQLKGGVCGCEVLTFLGWGAPVSGQAAFLNYELALGVNLMTHHDFSYATGSVAKRDCPPSYFFQQPYWPRYKLFHDAIARSTQLLTRGQYDASVLVLHPTTSCWVAMDGRGIGGRGNPFAARRANQLPDLRQLEDSLAAVSHELLKMRIGFEYGDEGILQRHGTVDRGCLTVGAMSYQTVVIPRVCHLLGSTVALLAEFQARGGNLIAVNPAHCLVDGETPPRPVFAGNAAVLTPVAIETPDDLRDLGLTPTLDLDTEEKRPPVICHTRVVDEQREHFICNMSDRPQRIEWSDCDLRIFDPVACQVITTDERKLSLPPFHAVHLLPTPPDEPSVPLAHTLLAVAESADGQVVPATTRSPSSDTTATSYSSHFI